MRRIGSKEPKSYPPHWCPIYQSPSKLCVYSLTEEGKLSYMLDRLRTEKGGPPFYPLAHHYTLRLETTSPVSAYQFWKEVEEVRFEQGISPSSIGRILEQEIFRYEILEIDDGINPAFFLLNSIFVDSFREKDDLQIISFNKELIWTPEQQN